MDEKNITTLPKVTQLVQTCGACPAQWEARTHGGKYIYIRYRYGCLAVGIGTSLMGAVDNTFNTDALFGEQIGGEYDGSIGLSEVIRHTDGLIDWSNYDYSDAD